MALGAAAAADGAPLPAPQSSCLRASKAAETAGRKSGETSATSAGLSLLVSSSAWTVCSHGVIVPSSAEVVDDRLHLRRERWAGARGGRCEQREERPAPPAGPRCPATEHGAPEESPGSSAMTARRMRLLVTGGAGYIGSVVAQQLLGAGHDVTVLDSLSRGHRAAVPGRVPASSSADLLDPEAASDARSPDGFDGVLHFAALALVAESVEHPERYYRGNVVGTLNLLDAMRAAGVGRLVFSSTARDLRRAGAGPDPRGRADRAGQRLRQLQARGRPDDRRRVPRARPRRPSRCATSTSPARAATLGEDHDPETHLIPLVLRAAAGRREHVTIFGTDYPTPDGTACATTSTSRTSAEAHLLALDAIEPGRHRDLQPRQRQRLLRARGDRGRAARSPAARSRRARSRAAPAIRRCSSPPTRRSARVLGWEPRKPRARDDDRRRVGLAPGPPGRLRRLHAAS